MSVLCTEPDIGGLSCTYHYSSYFHLLMYFSTQSMRCRLMRKLRKYVVCAVEENLVLVLNMMQFLRGCLF